MNNQGELATSVAAYQGAAIYSDEVLLRDGVGRVVERRETVQGVSSDYRYEYDAARRLAAVSVLASTCTPCSGRAVASIDLVA